MNELSGRQFYRMLVSFSVVGLLLSACGPREGLDYDTPQTKREARNSQTAETGKLFGPGGLFGGSGSEEAAAVGSMIPVNSYLWRASLDTLSFMPLSSADPFGGVIITDWYSPPEVDNERFKLTVYILSRQLRSDALRVSVFRQKRDTGGGWVDGEVSAGTAGELEDTILTRARELRVASVVE